MESIESTPIDAYFIDVYEMIVYELIFVGKLIIQRETNDQILQAHGLLYINLENVRR